MQYKIPQIIQQHDIILLDAICVICNGWAKFLIQNDHQKKFKLASVQSLLREAMLKHYGMSTGHYTAVAVILNGQRYLESTALLNVMRC